MNVGKCIHPPQAVHSTFGKELNVRVIVSTFVQRSWSHLLCPPHRVSGLVIDKTYEPGGVLPLALKFSLTPLLASHKSLNRPHILIMTSRSCLIWPSFPWWAPLWQFSLIVTSFLPYWISFRTLNSLPHSSLKRTSDTRASSSSLMSCTQQGPTDIPCWVRDPCHGFARPPASFFKNSPQS